MAEDLISFMSRIDCRFPYTDTAVAHRLIEQACLFGPEAVFRVIYEIAVPPRSARVTSQQRRDLLSTVEAKFTHPLLPLIARITRQMIDGECLTVPEAIAAMQVISPYRNQYGALFIPYYACDDVNGEADAVYEQIVARWQSEG